MGAGSSQRDDGVHHVRGIVERYIIVSDRGRVEVGNLPPTVV